MKHKDNLNQDFEDPIDSVDENDQVDEVDDIDGSKGWHVFRDHGQFGSHPMFDSMDDESIP